MRPLTLLLTLLLAAPAWGQDIGPTHPVMMGAKKGLVRPGLVGAWNLGTTNLLRWSEDLTNAAWVKVNTATAPTAHTTAHPAQDDRIYQVYSGGASGVTYTFSAKYSGTGTIRQEVECTSKTTYDITLTSTPTIHSISTTCGSAASVYAFVANRTGVNTATAVTVTEMQLNEGSTALPYQATTDGQRVPVGTSGAMPIRREIAGAVVYDPPPDPASRYTYSNGETRAVVGTNLRVQSEQLDDTTEWSRYGAGVSVTANAATAPDGTNTAEKLIGGSGVNYAQVYKNLGTNIATPTATISIHAKAAEASWLYLRMQISADRGCWFNVSSGVLGSCDSGAAASIVSVGAGWYRCSVSASGVVSTGVYQYAASLVDGDATGTFTGNGVDGLYLWGAQLNPGTLPDPYQKTEAVSLEPGYPFLQLGSTAGADANDPVRRLAGMVFDGVDDYLLSQSTVPANNLTLGVVANRSNTTNRHSLIGSRSASGLILFAGSQGGDALQWYPNTDGALSSWPGVVTASTWLDLALSQTGTAATAYSAGSKISTLTVPAVASGKVIEIGSWDSGAQSFYGTISHVLLYNRALSPREVRQNHQWLKAQMASVGVTLP